jgi:hypothetical protein
VTELTKVGTGVSRLREAEEIRAKTFGTTKKRGKTRSPCVSMKMSFALILSACYTLNSPHAQLHWIFGQIEAEQDNLKTAAQYSYAKNKYFEFLIETSAFTKSWLQIQSLK